MSPVPRVIACLDVDDGRVVKGVRFADLRVVGDPVAAGVAYEDQGADEIVFLDVSASAERRDTLVRVVRATASALTIPLTVGGGVRTADDVSRLLRSGADKVGVNTAAVARPALLTEAADAFGSQCVVVAIDAKREASGWRVYTHGGRTATDLDALAWAVEAERLGAGEFLVTSMDRDGTRAGYDLDLYRALRRRLRRPLIASGGFGRPAHAVELLKERLADAALVAGVLHEGSVTISEMKDAIARAGVGVRMEV
ncbi:MAG: imidazole glycerol phosphate synthase subunit HisF [Methanobacteriota archaeon]